MACNCGKGKKKVTYVATFADGTTKVYSSEVEARIAVQRNGGSYRAAA